MSAGIDFLMAMATNNGKKNKRLRFQTATRASTTELWSAVRRKAVCVCVCVCRCVGVYVCVRVRARPILSL